MITGFDHVHFLCEDVEKSVKYFEDFFDAKILSKGAARGFPVVRMDVKGSMVIVMGADPKAPALEVGKGNRGLDHFGVRVVDLENTVADLKKKGGTISVEPTVTADGVKYAYIDGPDGIRIELVERA